MKNRRLWIILAGLAVIAAAFSLINFHAAVSNTQAEHTYSTFSSGERLPDAMQQHETISIVMEGDGRLARAVQKTVLAQMSEAGMGSVELAQSVDGAYPGPVLLMRIDSQSLLWTPVYATAQITLTAGYASNGDTTFMGETPVTLNSADGPTINMSGDFKVKDTSWGIISRPGYEQMLADAAAPKIVEAVRTLYKPK